MSRKKRSYTAITGLLTAFCLVIISAQNAWAQTENNSENSTSEAVIFLREGDSSSTILLKGSDAETRGANTSQTIVLEIDDVRTRESPAYYLSMVLLVLLLLVFSLLLIHILMHHTREDGESTTTPLPSLLGDETDPIEDRQPLLKECEEDISPLPLALCALEAFEHNGGPGPSTRAPSMGYPIGLEDLNWWEEIAVEEAGLEGAIV